MANDLLASQFYILLYILSILLIYILTNIYETIGISVRVTDIKLTTGYTTWPLIYSLSLFLAEDSCRYMERHGVDGDGTAAAERDDMEAGAYDEEDDDEELAGSRGGLGEKKRRLAADQVRELERSFEVDNKLDPERKARIARDLSLHPRQVAVWFQNRRARWKTKQIERDFAALRARHDALRAECDALRRDKDALAAEVRTDRAAPSTPPGLYI